MKRQIIFTLLIAVIFFSCEKDADIKLPEEDPKLAVFGFLSPEDTATIIRVNVTTPYFGKKNQDIINAITNARVKITHLNKEFILPLNVQTMYYSLDSSILKINPGEEYFLEVSAENYPTVTSSVIIKENINKTLEYIDYTRISNSNNTYMNVRWVDNANEKNFYRLAGFYSFTIQGTDTKEHGFFGINDLLLYDDVDWNGLVKSSNDLIISNYLTEANFNFILLDIDYHYYQYHRSIRDFEKNEENPFSEPVIVYSNIKGGSGVFASFRKYEIRENIIFN